MTVYFANAGKIDLDVIRVMGVSVKKSDNPIGYFGTGLKFAIATLLRTGHKITLRCDDDVYRITARSQEIRGESFGRVYMNDEPLPFTTALGKNWEVWQAYRELHSNTLDEDGAILDKPMQADTVIEVTGDAIQREYVNRDSIFISGKPIARNEFLEVYDGATNAVFYRGVRAGVMPEGMMFTYNILAPMTLTEDRTFESQFHVEWKLSGIIPKLDNKGMFAQLLAGRDKFDQNLNFTQCHSPSQAFLDAAAECYADSRASASAKRVIDRDNQERGVFTPAKMLDADHAKFLTAFSTLQRMGCGLSPEDVEVVESLGPSVMGLFHKTRNQIFLAKSTLDWGAETVVATLYEEWLHKEYFYKDKSRELQNFLLQRLVALTIGATPPEPEKQGLDGVPF